MRFAPAVLLLLALTPALRAQQQDSHVSAQARLDTTAVAPATPFTLAITLTIDAGYHIYWSNPGETGIATSISLKLPAGFSATPMLLPLPHTFTQPGNIVGYGYSGATTFLYTINPPPSLGDNVAIGANISYLCCNDQACTPGSAKLSVPLATSGAAQSANADFFLAAMLALPVNAPANFPKPVIAPAADKKSLTVTLPLPSDFPSKSIEAFPDAPSTLSVSRPQVTDDKTSLSFTIHPYAGQKITSNDLPLLVIYTTNDNKRHGFFIPVSLDALKTLDAK
jgi:thiol:disulfide interchange protein DsbD